MLMMNIAHVKIGCAIALLVGTAASRAGDAYFDVSLGASLINDVELTDIATGTVVDYELDAGFGMTFELGKNLTDNVSLGLVSGFAMNSIGSASIGGAGITGDLGDVTIVPFMARLGYQGNLGEKLTGGIGVSLGGYYIDVKPEGALALVYSDDSTTGFAYSFDASCGYALSEKASLGLLYRFTGYNDVSFEASDNDNVFGHFIGAALNYKF
jgi:opacity protein-like surface antigen